MVCVYIYLAIYTLVHKAGYMYISIYTFRHIYIYIGLKKKVKDLNSYVKATKNVGICIKQALPTLGSLQIILIAIIEQNVIDANKF